MLLNQMTWPQVDDYLKSNDRILVPIGSTEQHGPTGVIGTDYVTAQGIAEATGQKFGLIVAPPICYGMAFHHMGFPGSASLTPKTYMSVLCDLIGCFYQHGFRRIYFVNGHGGNIAPTTTAFCEFKVNNDDAELHLWSWFLLPEVIEYEKQHFKDKNGSHATPGEVSVTKFLFPETFKGIESTQFEVKPEKTHWPLGPQEYRKLYPDGRIDSNPGLATFEHGKALFEIAVNAIGKRVTD